MTGREHIFDENREQLPDFVQTVINNYLGDQHAIFNVIGTIKVYQNARGKWLVKLRCSKRSDDPCDHVMTADDYVDLARIKAHPIETLKSSFWWCMTQISEEGSEIFEDKRAEEENA